MEDESDDESGAEQVSGSSRVDSNSRKRIPEDSYFKQVQKRSKQDSTRKKYKYYQNRVKKGVLAHLGDTQSSIVDVEISALNPVDIVEFIGRDSRKRDGSLQSASHTESYRNALIDYYRSNKLGIPDEVEDKIDALTAQRCCGGGSCMPQCGPSSTAPLRLNQAVTSSFRWPSDLTLRELHELWYEDNPATRQSALGTITKKLTESESKRRSEAKYCVQTINSCLSCSIDEYLGASYSERDRLFRVACEVLCAKLVELGHKATKETMMGKLARNSFRTFYNNDFKLLPK